MTALSLGCCSGIGFLGGNSTESIRDDGVGSEKVSSNPQAADVGESVDGARIGCEAVQERNSRVADDE